jgi:NADH:ubiquinone oxidoreductase subunit 3 (subunit A)
MDYLLKNGIISIVFVLIGAVVYLVINYLLDSIGKEGIDRVYESKKEKQTRERIKKKVGKMYAMLLFLLVIGINIIFYYFRNQST